MILLKLKVTKLGKHISVLEFKLVEIPMETAQKHEKLTFRKDKSKVVRKVNCSSSTLCNMYYTLVSAICK